MSTLNAPPPPLPDQNANTVTTTSDAPRGDQKTMEVLASGNELATRLFEERTRLELLAREQLAADAAAKKAEEIRREQERRAEEVRREEERAAIARLSVETHAINHNAAIKLLKYGLVASIVAGGAACLLTKDDGASKNKKKSKKST